MIYLNNIFGCGLPPFPSSGPVSCIPPFYNDSDVVIRNVVNTSTVNNNSDDNEEDDDAVSPVVCNNCSLGVKIVDSDYVIGEKDCYVASVKKGVTISLPKGVLGKCYVIKNKDTGNVKVNTIDDALIDNSDSKVLGSRASITVVYDGISWSIIG